MTEQAKVSIASRLVAAMGEIDAVTKEGKNQAQNYNYVRAADVANEVRKVLVKHGIAFGFDVIEEERWMTDRFDRQGTIVGHMNYVRIVADVSFEDSLTGEMRIRKGRGWGQDVGEKAIYKAMTGALKDALRMNFIIPDESDPENEERTTPEQALQKPVQSRTPVAPVQPPRLQTTQPSTAAPKSSPDQAPEGSFALVGELLECVIRGVTPKTTKAGKPYLTVVWNGRIGSEKKGEGLNYGFCYHQSLVDAINAAIGKPCILKLKEKRTPPVPQFLNGSIECYYIEDVLYIDGTDYENGQPKPKAEAQPVLVTDSDIPF